MLGDVRYPELVRFLARELTTDPIRGSGMRRGLPIARTAGEALDAGRAHQLLDGLVANCDALSEDEFGVDSTRTVGASRSRMDCADAVRQPDVSHRPR